MLDQLKKDAFRNMKWTGFSSTYVSIFQLMNTVVLALFLDPSEIGTMSAMLLVIWFTQYIADGGMSPAIIHHEKNDPGILNILFYINVGIATFLYFLSLLLAEPISGIFDEPRMIEYMPVALISMFVTSFGNQFKVILMKFLRFDLIAGQEMVGMTVNSVVSISMAWQGYGVWSMVIGHVSGVITGNIVLIANAWSFWRPGLHVSTRGLAPYLRFGLFQLGERFSLFLNTRLDQIIIGAVLGTYALGIYTIAHNLVISPTIRVNQIISSVMLPVFAKVQSDLEIIRKGYLKLVKLVTLINTPVMLGIALTAPLFIPILFNENWIDSIYIIQILSLYSLIRSTGSPAGSLQLALGRADLGFKWNVALVFISAPVLYLGATLNGIDGVSYALVAMHASLFVPYWILMIKPLIGPPARDYFRSVSTAATPGFVMALVVYTVLSLGTVVSQELLLILSILAGVISFCGFSYYSERGLITEIIDQLHGNTSI